MHLNLYCRFMTQRATISLIKYATKMVKDAIRSSQKALYKVTGTKPDVEAGNTPPTFSVQIQTRGQMGALQARG